MKFIGYTILTLLSAGILGIIIAFGAAAWLVNYYGSDIPDYNALKTYEPDVVTRVYTSDGNLMAEFATEKRIFVPIEVIPPLVKQAFISAEDKNFYDHKGLDYLGIAKAIADKVMNPTSQLRGASTITQQVAKNFLLTNERSFERKLKEAILAIRMERAMSKDRLLELYLNEIYLGAGMYGVAAAAQKYFGKSLDDLAIEEAAYLAALPKAPNNYHPIRQVERATARRNWVIGRLAEDGVIMKAQADIARAKPLEVIDMSSKNKLVRAPYFAEEIRRSLQNEFGSEGLYEQGLIVRSSINPQLQKIAEMALRDGLIAYDLRHGYRRHVAKINDLDNWQNELEKIPFQLGMLRTWKLAVMLGGRELGFKDGSQGTLSQSGLKWGGDKIKKGSVIMVEKDFDENIYRLRQIPEVEGGFVVMDPHTGRVLAIQGGWSYNESEFNRATQAERQPGSSFKPFVYLTALETGLTPTTLVMDSPAEFEQGPNMPLWRPQNYSHDFYGPTTLRTGIEKSRNVMTVRLADKIGMDSVAATANDFGIYNNMPSNLASSLGSNETTLMRMVVAYGMVVNGGKKIQPSFIDRIQNRYGKTVYKRDSRQCLACGPSIQWDDTQVIAQVPSLIDLRDQVKTPQLAYQMVSILKGAVQRGTGAGLKNLGIPVAGKTGTTNDAKDAWFVGFTPDLVFGAYVGFDKPRSLGNRETGSSVALPIVKKFLNNAINENLLDPKPFRVPPGLSMIQINAQTGRRAQPFDNNVIWETFLSGQSPDDQEVIFGGERIVFNEPSMNYGQFYSRSAGARFGTEMYGPFLPHQNPWPTVSNPSHQQNLNLQGTGGLY